MSTIPTFTKQKAVDENGNFTPEMQQFFDILIGQLQSNISNDGIVLPQLPTSEINNIASPSNANGKTNATLWFDSETGEFKGSVNGVVKTFTMS